MSPSGGIGSTLTGGIQYVAAIVPLLGTEQCWSKSALHLHADIHPHLCLSSEASGWSAQDSRHSLLAFSFGDIEGAKILGNMGFDQQGENLSLIMVEGGKGKNAGRYIIETRMDELIKELNTDKNRITGVLVSHKSADWNVKMVATTALLCAFGITPYIYPNLVANNLTKVRLGYSRFCVLLEASSRPQLLI